MFKSALNVRHDSFINNLLDIERQYIYIYICVSNKEHSSVTILAQVWLQSEYVTGDSDPSRSDGSTCVKESRKGVAAAAVRLRRFASSGGENDCGGPPAVEEKATAAVRQELRRKRLRVFRQQWRRTRLRVFRQQWRSSR